MFANFGLQIIIAKFQKKETRTHAQYKDRYPQRPSWGPALREFEFCHFRDGSFFSPLKDDAAW